MWEGVIQLFIFTDDAFDGGKELTMMTYGSMIWIITIMTKRTMQPCQMKGSQWACSIR